VKYSAKQEHPTFKFALFLLGLGFVLALMLHWCQVPSPNNIGYRSLRYIALTCQFASKGFRVCNGIGTAFDNGHDDSSAPPGV
jgi:hypothetical protein